MRTAEINSMSDKKPVQGPYQQVWESWCYEVDRHVCTPIQQGGKPEYGALVRLFSRFGEWETVKADIDTCLETEDWYRNLHDDVETERDELQDKVDNMQSDLADVVADMRWFSTDMETADKEEYNKLLKKLDTIAEGDRVKKVKNKKR